MAFSHVASSLVLFTLTSSSLLFLQPHPTNANSLIDCHFDKIYNFGDSLSDTGNLIREKPIGPTTAYAKLPYGETFFKHATGRPSNGRLMIDFIAQASGLPFLNPYLEKDADFKHGVNFAVTGAAALTTEDLAKMNIIDTLTNSSLEVQLGQTIQDATNLVPQVVAAIISGVRRVIVSFGAVKVVVPGIFPNGCFPIYLTLFQTNDSSAYDKHRCLKDTNAFANYHNEKLQEAIQELKKEYPDVVIVYGDYYRAFLWLFDHAVELGFDGKTTQKACCGIGGDYNFSLTNMCSSEVPVCPNPNRFISWDGIHLTEAAYKRMAEWLINNIVPKLQCCN
ncbi:hypothetical protein RHSIM_Rhsim07G0189500 [Rhododendron simsii]|uniref:Uncharacterized protein n=1 Tax=Rhododendron simsii TaxID=118357 RepID=A0A834GL75_RHOSS|nr:hypothetical protein RHSIM_Rhsim07G0189500 [Rhododendron simsii]